MNGEKELSQLVKGLNPKLNQGEYVFVCIEDLGIIDRKDTMCEFKEREGTTLIINRRKADELHLKYDYVASWITLEVYSSLQSIGLTALFSKELTHHQISCNVIAGYHHDHIFVAKKDAVKAVQVLSNWSKKHNKTKSA